MSPPENMEILTNNNKNTYPKRRKKINCFTFILVCGILNLIIGLSSIFIDYFDVIMKERTRMREGFPPMEYWRDPPVPLLLSITYFNVLNPESFLNGTDDKLIMEEVGPIVYRQIQKHTNIVYHDNDTISFTIERKAEFIKEANEPGILNKTIISPNGFLLSLSSYLHDAFFWTKQAFNVVTAGDHVFINRTVYELLWNLTTPSLNVAKRFVPFLLPRKNGGTLFNLLYPLPTKYNVNIGPNRGYEKFFSFNTVNGNEKVPGFEYEERETCPIWLEDCRDGGNFPPNITKDNVFKLWRENVCQTHPLHFEKEEKWEDFDAYKFSLTNDTYMRLEDPDMDCLKQSRGFLLPSGLADHSKCAFGLPTAVSNPHFYGYPEGEWDDYLEGMSPDPAKHSTYIILEPKTGMPLEEVARLQSNIPIPKLKGFRKNIMRMSGKIIPIFWAEYKLDKLTPEIQTLTKILIALPTIQMVCIITFLAFGATLTYVGIKGMTCQSCRTKSSKKKKIEIIKDKPKIVETVSFLPS